MKNRLIGLSLALGLVLATPVYANAAAPGRCQRNGKRERSVAGREWNGRNHNRLASRPDRPTGSRIG